MSKTGSRWIRSLVAVLAGNAIYFLLEPHLPFAARHRAWRPDLGTAVDFWFCLAVYGLLEGFAYLRNRPHR